MPKRVHTELGVADLPQADPRVAELLTDLDRQWLVTTLKELTGAKYATINGARTLIRSRCNINNGLQNALSYLKQFYTQLGAQWQVHCYHSMGVDLENLVVTFPGARDAESIVIVGSHIDSTAGGWDNEKVAPGADDNASGTVACMQLAVMLTRLKELGLEPQRTIRIVHFSAEEEGRRGSLVYADHCKRSGDEVAAMIQLDMIGYCRSDEHPLSLHCWDRSPQSRAIVDLLVEACTQYQLHLSPQVVIGPLANSDHRSFSELYYPAALISQQFVDGKPITPHNHSRNDRVETLNIPYLIEATKLMIAAVCSLTGVSQT